MKGLFSKKNVIFIVCDGLTYNMLEDKKNHVSPMPFLKSLRNNCLWCTEAYAHGPYTEAAIKSVIHGKMPLESGGYYVEHTKWDDSVFKAFKDLDYDLFTSFFISYIPPEVTENDVFSYNTLKANPMFSRYFKGKLDYYFDIWKNNELSSKDIIILKRFLDRTFESIFMVYGEMGHKRECSGEFTPYYCNDEDFAQRETYGLKQLREEYKKYSSDKDGYIFNLFENYNASRLVTDFDWDGSVYDEPIKAQKKWIDKEYTELFKTIKRKNRRLYIRNHFPSANNIFNHTKYLLSPQNRKRGIEFFGRLYMSVNSFDTSKMTGVDLPQICTSAGCFVDQFIDWREKKKTDNKPYFTYLHFDEFHRPLSFISHETKDYSRLRQEFCLAQKYVSTLSKEYEGVVGFDLAAQYIDYSIHRLFEYLKNNGELDNTIIVITADHGSSNCGETERFTCTNHFFREQYHIPLIIYGGDSRTISGFVHGVDLLPTIAEMVGFPCNESWCGDSILHATHDYTTVEYTGSGVSDLLRRPVKFGYRDKEKSFVVEGMVNSSPDAKDVKLLEYYDLVCDPNEITNISGKISTDKVKFCKTFFLDRLKYLYYDYNQYLKEINEQK